jgi:hypothetical protein
MTCADLVYDVNTMICVFSWCILGTMSTISTYVRGTILDIDFAIDVFRI